MPDTLDEQLKRIEAALQQAETTVTKAAAPRTALQKAADWGLPSTAGAIVGGIVGGIPGAMGGAALARGAQGYFTGEGGEDTARGMLGQAAGEAFLPVGGRLLTLLGKRAVRAALPIERAVAEEVGHGQLTKGAQQLAASIAHKPGVTLKGTARGLERQMQQAHSLDATSLAKAETAGTRIPSGPVIGRGEDLLAPGGALTQRIASPATTSGAQRTLQQFKKLATHTRPATEEELRTAATQARSAKEFFDIPTDITEVQDFTPTQARDILKNTEFFSGSPDIPGADVMGRALREELSAQYKQAVPGAEEAFAQMHELIPEQKTVDLARFLSSQQGMRSPEMLIGGGRPRALGIIPVPRGGTFAAGKLAVKAGRTVEDAVRARILTALARAGLGEMTRSGK